MSNTKTGLQEYNRCANCGGKITSNLNLICCCNKQFCSQECADEYHSQRKEDNSDGSNENCLETRNITGEDNKDEQMPVDVDNLADSLKGNGDKK